MSVRSRAYIQFQEEVGQGEGGVWKLTVSPALEKIADVHYDCVFEGVGGYELSLLMRILDLHAI